MRRLAALLLVLAAAAGRPASTSAQSAAPDTTLLRAAAEERAAAQATRHLDTGDSTAGQPALGNEPTGPASAVAPEGGAVASPPDTTTPPPPSDARRARTLVGLDADRLELGAAIVDGPYAAIGTFGYHRYVRTGYPFEQWAHLEISGAGTRILKEGTVSLGYLLRPVSSVHRSWRVRPIVEFGPAAHLVVQVADVQGFGQSAFHARMYLKTHAYLGVEALLGPRWGLLARGRGSVPAHRPLDYAQIALFLR
ncbi:MAG: hypothetical protein ACM3PF_01325 [Bacteroidota bacterium]